MTRIRRVLHPSDFSPASARAFAFAVDMAKANRAELVLVHVMAPVVPMVSDAYISPRTYTDLQRSVQVHSRRRLDALAARAKKSRIRTRTLLLEGSPAERIVRAAKSGRAGMVVMGTHGRGGLARLLLGSVAERVIGTAPCPVLTVRGR